MSSSLVLERTSGKQRASLRQRLVYAVDRESPAVSGPARRKRIERTTKRKISSPTSRNPYADRSGIFAPNRESTASAVVEERSFSRFSALPKNRESHAKASKYRLSLVLGVSNKKIKSVSCRPAGSKDIPCRRLAKTPETTETPDAHTCKMAAPLPAPVQTKLCRQFSGPARRKRIERTTKRKISSPTSRNPYADRSGIFAPNRESTASDVVEERSFSRFSALPKNRESHAKASKCRLSLVLGVSNKKIKSVSCRPAGSKDIPCRRLAKTPETTETPDAHTCKMAAPLPAPVQTKLCRQFSGPARRKRIERTTKRKISSPTSRNPYADRSGIFAPNRESTASDVVEERSFSRFSALPKNRESHAKASKCRLSLVLGSAKKRSSLFPVALRDRRIYPAADSQRRPK